MTKAETISNLKAYLNGDVAIGNIIPLRSVLESALEYLEPSLPSNLDEAAEASALTVYPENIQGDCRGSYDLNLLNRSKHIDGFKAGAEWRDAQIQKLPDNLDEAAEEYAQEEMMGGLAERAFKAGADWRDQQIPKLPDNVDKAAESWCDENASSCDYIGSAVAEQAFKSGAKWMAEQGVTRECPIGLATEEIYCNITEKTLDELGICPGDKVLIQIRKI